MVIQSARVQKALTLRNRQFKQLFGVPRQTFDKMLEILQAAFEKLHQRGGKLSQVMPDELHDRLTAYPN